MCSNYRAVTRADRLLTYFGVERAHDAPSTDTYPAGLAPCIIRAASGEALAGHELALVDAVFRLVPDFVAKVTWARHTYNARSETVASKPTYRGPWRAGQRCIIPVEWIYEPNHESGRHERWRIQQPGGAPFGVAGIYQTYEHQGKTWYTMAMLTVNADDHPFMRRFHEPDEEKRMVVILDRADWVRWLNGTEPEARALLRPWHGPLEGFPDPAPGRAPRATGGKVIRPPPQADDDPTGQLF